jgi:hypothetical protein
LPWALSWCGEKSDLKEAFLPTIHPVISFSFPSTTDSFSNLVLDLQASGQPAIVTKCGEPQENVPPLTRGFAVLSGFRYSFAHAVGYQGF